MIFNFVSVGTLVEPKAHPKMVVTARKRNWKIAVFWKRNFISELWIRCSRNRVTWDYASPRLLWVLDSVCLVFPAVCLLYYCNPLNRYFSFPLDFAIDCDIVIPLRELTLHAPVKWFQSAFVPVTLHYKEHEDGWVISSTCNLRATRPGKQFEPGARFRVGDCIKLSVSSKNGKCTYMSV